MNKLFRLAILFLITSVSCLSATEAGTEIRAALDIGSGSTKISIAEVNKTTNQIVQTLFDGSFPVPYQVSLEKSQDGSFDAEIREKGLNVFHEIKKMTESYGVEKIVAVATAAFREASNASEYAKEVSEKTAIDIQIITQPEEGKIAFFSAIAVNDVSPDDIVVWDIGTGSLQITTLTEEQNFCVLLGKMGSVPFRDYVIEVLQDKDPTEVNTPNPISEDDFKEADRFARSLARKAYPTIKDKIKNQRQVIGIGRLFYHSIRPLLTDGNQLNRKDLRNYIAETLNKTDEELNDPYANVNLTNCILVLAYMKALHIQEVTAVDTTSAKGLLVYPAYWNN
jgi:exopolyphosphatase/guanosine-5'-triphosphate,3'-diphosphate pyrophosphatase